MSVTRADPARADPIDEATLELVRACLVERAFEVQVQAKGFDDAIWARYVTAIGERRAAVDALREAGAVDVEAYEDVGMGL